MGEPSPHKSVQDLNIDELRSLIEYATTLLKEKTDTDDFSPEIRKRAKKAGTSTETPVIETTNRYAVLEDNVDAEMTEETPAMDRQIKTPTAKPRPNPTPTNDTASGKQPKIAPIFLKETEKWKQANALMTRNDVRTTKCKLVSSGIQIDPATENDYRCLKKILENEKLQFFTYQLRSEKTLKVVLRGIIHSTTTEEVQSDLLEKGYPTERITRMNGKNGRPAPLILVELKREYKSIYDLTNCCGLAISVEPLKTKTDVIQCHKCQLFGHVQKNCHIDYRCMKCGENHSTHECAKPRTTPPKCANCGGEHLATFLKCPKNPNNPDNITAKTVPQPPKVNPWFRNKQIEEPEKTKQTPTTNNDASKSTTSDDLALTIGKMLIILNNTNATQQQKIDFITQTENITKYIHNGN